MAAVAHEEGWGASGTAGLGVGHIFPDACCVALFVDVAEEPLDVEAEAPGVASEILELKLVLVCEEQVMHVPEPVLDASRLRGRGREFGVGVHVGERQVPDDVPQTVAEVFPNLLGHSRGAGAKRALEVCVLHQGQGSGRRAEDVVARCIHGPDQGRRQLSGGLSVQDGG